MRDPLVVVSEVRTRGEGGSRAKVSITDTNKKTSTPLHRRWVAYARGPPSGDDEDQKINATRRTPRRKSYSLAQPPHGQLLVRNERATVQRA